MRLRLPDSGAAVDANGRRHAPSAARNADAILAQLQAVLPASGRLLEVASGTGQHAAEFAAELAGWHWQPSDVNAENFGSIAAWSQGVANVAPPVVLDAAGGWPAGPWDAVLIVNLLHLIGAPAAQAVLRGMAGALSPQGTGVIYGPFLRDGVATSEGDAQFDASLRAQDPAIGYKDLAWVVAQLAALGLGCRVVEMPANNLMLITARH